MNLAHKPKPFNDILFFTIVTILSCVSIYYIWYPIGREVAHAVAMGFRLGRDVLCGLR